MELVYELRIGNLVSKSLKSGNGRTLIDKVGPQDIVRIYENISHFNYHSIPITEEWLLKFGFEKGQFLKDTWDNGSIIISLKYDIFYYELLNDIVDIKYVHQLQNLHFTITGKELTYSDVI